MNTSFKDIIFRSLKDEEILTIRVNTDSYNPVSRIADAYIHIKKNGLLLTADGAIDYWNLKGFAEDLDKLNRLEITSLSFPVSFEQIFTIKMKSGNNGTITNTVEFESFEREYSVVTVFDSDLSFIPDLISQIEVILSKHK